MHAIPNLNPGLSPDPNELPTCQVSLKNAEGQSLGVTLQHSNIVTKVTACWLGLGLGLGLGR